MLAVFLTLPCVGRTPSAGFAAPFVGATAALTEASAELFEGLPNDFNVQPPSQISTLLTSDDSEITKFYAENHIVAPLNSILVNMQSVVVAAEDQRFYQHQGVDLTSMVRVLVSNNVGDSRQGASTLTQQYVRSTLIETGLKNNNHKPIRDVTESTVVHKLREMKFAPGLEQKYSEQQTSEGYPSIAAFSPSTYGAEAPSLHYFNKHAKDLTVVEIALSARTTDVPSAYDPKSQPELAKNRRDWVLVKILGGKFITKQQYDEAVNSETKLDIRDSPVGCGATGSYAYFCTYMINEILGSENFGPNVAARRQFLTRSGLKITTTLNPERQGAADSVIQTRTLIGGSDGANSTVVSIEPGTGRIQALAQNTNYEDSQLVFVADTKHSEIELPDGNVGFQPGSTFKAIILAEWFKTGHTPYQMLNVSVPKNYGPNTFTVSCDPDCTVGSWSVNNVVGTDAGMMTVREATEQSTNTGFTEMLRNLDVCKVTKFATPTGITKVDGSQLDPDPSIALRSMPVPPLGMANVYAASASGGKYCKLIAIDQILDASGALMAIPSADCIQTMDRGAAGETTKMLRAISESGGTAGDAVFGRPTAGKIGTTDEAENTWSVGFTSQLSTAVWTGDAMESGRSLVGRMIGGVYFPRIYGSDLAVPMWCDYMSQVVADSPALPIPPHG